MIDDSIAIECLKEGDISGLETLVERYQERAVYSAFLILFDRTLAEEVVQNAFIKVFSKIRQFSNGKPFYPWFCRIIINDSIKLANKRKRFTSLDEIDDEESIKLAHWLIDPHPLPEEQFIIKNDLLSLRKALLCLTPEYRVVIVMRYYLEIDDAEMAERLEKPISTVKWWLRAARKKLGAILQSESKS